MKLTEIYPSTYLKAADLQGRNVSVTIDRIEFEKLGDDTKPVMYFQGKERGLVLNKTNANTVAAVYGDDTDDWSGGALILYQTRVDYQGKSVDAIRVRVPPVKPAARGNVVINGKPVNARDGQDDPRVAAMSGPNGPGPDDPDDSIPF